MADQLQETARGLALALRDGRLTDPIPDALLADDVSAYAVQARAIVVLGEPLAGWKVGATNPKAQAMLGTERPFYGPIPSRLVVEDGGELAPPPGLRGAEIEIAFRLAKPLRHRDSPWSRDELIEAIASAHPAIELVGGRQKLEGLGDARRATADFGAHVAFVAGPAIDGWQQLDPAEIEARCLIDGEVKAQGRADVVLGSPLNALAWLADNGPGLDAGHWVSTGTITGLTPVAPGQRIEGDLGPLGRVSVGLRSS